jgi:hypothetical protein
MPPPLRIAYENLADAGTVTASSALSALSADRVQAEDIEDVWRAATNPAWLLADLGSEMTVGIAALINSNAGLTDTARVRVSTVDASGSAGDAYDSGVFVTAIDTVHEKLIHFIEPGVSGRYVLIDLDQGETPEAGRLFIARGWTPTHNFSFGWEPLSRDWSISTMSLGLNLFKDKKRKQEGARFILNGITEDEYENQIRPLNRLAGTSREILVCRDINAANLGAMTYWGEMGREVRVTQPHPDFFTAEFEIWNRL